ncbi:MAG: hypothetical protein WCS52_02075 [bacterium]
MAKETAVTVRRENMPAPVQTFDEIEKLGLMFERSGMFGCSAQGQGVVLAMTCMMQRITPLEFIQTYHIVEGRPTMRADAMLAKLIEDGGDYKIIQRDAEGASVWMKCGSREGTFTFTHEDAKAEPFYWKKDGKMPKDNYATPRKRMQMLWARVTSDGARTVDPGAVKGTYSPEEVQDFTDDERVGRAKVVTPEAPPMTAKPATTVTVKPEETVKPAATIDVSAEVVSEQAAEVFVMPFGKFKGKALTELGVKTLQAIADTKTPSDEAITTAKSIIADEKASADDKSRAEMTLNMARLTEAHKAEAQKILNERTKAQ